MEKGIKVISGGVKDFVYSEEDIKRIQSNDTESTRSFKNELKFKRQYPIRYWWKYNQLKVIFILILISMMLFFLILK